MKELKITNSKTGESRVDLSDMTVKMKVPSEELNKKCICNHSNPEIDCYPKTRCACKVHGKFFVSDLKKECDCEETSCQNGCTKPHTHKTFWCEKCHPERYSEELKKEWEREFDSLFGKDKFHPFVANYAETKSFISSLLAKQQEEFVKCIPEIELPYESRLCQNQNSLEYCGTCEQAWEYCSCSARNSGYKKCIADIKSKLNK
jgi:hypothetical protein